MSCMSHCPKIGLGSEVCCSICAFFPPLSSDLVEKEKRLEVSSHFEGRKWKGVGGWIWTRASRNRLLYLTIQQRRLRSQCCCQSGSSWWRSTPFLIPILWGQAQRSTDRGTKVPYLNPHPRPPPPARNRLHLEELPLTNQAIICIIHQLENDPLSVWTTYGRSF